MVGDKNVKEPQKGLNLRIQEAKQGIADAINKYQLPPGIVLMILNEFTGQTQAQNARMIEAEKRAFEEEGEKHGKEIHKAELAE